MRPVVGSLAVLLCCASAAAAGPHGLKGRRLEDALRLLQSEGLPIVFSSEIVTPQMHVTIEPEAASPRRQLDEILAPNGLVAEAGPGGVIIVLRAHDMPASKPAPNAAVQKRTAGRAVDGSGTAAPDTTTYTDRVTVSAADGVTTHGGSISTQDRASFQESGATMEPEGMAAVHSMPRVSAVDDFHSEFSVRGSPYRQIGIVIDGVATPWLQHAVYGRNDHGSLSMFGSGSLDNATLQAGAYPRVYDDTLGAQLELSLREGSRQSMRLSGTAGGLTTAVDGEGPIGSSGRGSWIVGVRNSYASWPPGPHSASDPGFAFSDLHAKLVYDVSPTQQVSLTALGGMSSLDTIEELRVAPLVAGTDHAELMALRWQSILPSHTVVRQEFFGVGQGLSGTLSTGESAGSSSNRAIGYQGQILRPLAGGVLQAGGEMSRVSGSREAGPFGSDMASISGQAAWMTHAGYVDFSRTARGGSSFEAGARVSDSTLVRQHAVSPWILGAWRLSKTWTVNGSVGASRQFADLDAVLAAGAQSRLEPERATHVDAGIEQRFSNGFRWQATFFHRLDHDVLRDPATTPRLVQGVIVEPPVPSAAGNALSGASRGLELVAIPGHAGRLSGWLSYSYARTLQHDTVTEETFYSDFDRRHTFNGTGTFRFGAQTNATLVMRAASGVPIPGYFEMRDGLLVVGDRLNVVRLPAYARLDARVQRRLFSSRHEVTLFAEVLNALNKRNEGLAAGSIQSSTGEAIGFTQSLLPRRASVGIHISWSR
jgi:hypothetical protein